MASNTFVPSSRRQTQGKTTFSLEPRVRQAIARIADSDCPVLIAGEAGVGKREIAALIHAQSQLSRGQFFEIRASECDSQQLLSALATRGTTYLAEVADLSIALQDLIVEQYFQAEQKQGRLLCGTSRELSDQIRSRRMREYFFHLISTVTFRVSPLRLRRPEILSIADALLTQYSKQFDRPRPTLSRDVTEFLLAHHWPGNLTEFDTAIKTVVAIGDQAISLAALKAAAPSATPSGPHRQPSLKQAVRAASFEVERQLISEVLIATHGNRKRAADELGISYKALLYKLKQVESEPQVNSNGNGHEL